MDVNQLKNYVIIPSISAIGMYSVEAVQLLLMTCATETHLGQYIKQANLGYNDGAFGIYQQQALSYNELYDNLITPSQSMTAKMRLYLNYVGKPPVQRLMTDCALATIMARMFYHNIPEPIPEATNVEALAYYYKKYYNTEMGKAKVPEVITAYKLLVLKC